MAVARILNRAELGLDAPLVQVQVHLGRGLPAFSIAPSAGGSREPGARALGADQFRLRFPARRITINLAPVERSKRGARFDLPFALGVLLASGQLRGRPAALLERSCRLPGLSARGVQRVLAVSRTSAALAASDTVARTHLAEAIQLRRPPAGGCELPERDRLDQWPTSDNM